MKKIIPKDEVIEDLKSYYTEDEIEVIFAYHTDHPIEIVNGTVRWVKTIEYSIELGNDPNQMVRKYINGEITQKEYMEYNRQIGYSLYGYWEVFCFNDRFDKKQYDINMIQEREDKINNLI